MAHVVVAGAGRPIPRDHEDRLFQALGGLEQNHRVDLAANAVYDYWRATARDTKGRAEAQQQTIHATRVARGRDQSV